MAAVLYSCKRCKVGRRVDYPNPSKLYRGAHWREGVAIGRDRASQIYPGAALTYRGFDGACRYDGDPLAICPSCSRPMAWGYVKGISNPAVRCDARCTHARGHNCECSCGGENHGKAWA